MADEQVRFDILINAKAAIKELREMSESATSVQDRVAKFSSFLVQKSREWNVPVQQLLNTFKQLNAEMAKQKGQSIFGNVGGKNVFNLSEDFLKSAQAAGRFKVSADGVVTSLRNAKGVSDAAGASTKNVGNAMHDAAGKSRGWAHGIDIVRTALGTLVAVGIFQVIQAFQSMVSGALKGLKEIEAATFNLVNAEKRLSEQGIEVSVQGLEKLIEDLQKLDPMLSKFQATELVSTLATKVAPAFGFGTAEIDRMAKAITVLAIRNQALGKSFEEVQQQVITGLLSGKVTAGINQLGLKITDQIVKEEAVTLGLVRSAEAYDQLNAKAQERVNILTIISILEKETAQEAATLPSFLQTASGMIGVAKAEFQDILTSLGQKFAPVLKEALRGIIQFLERLNQSLTENGDSWNTLVTIITAFARFASVVVNGLLDIALAVGKVGDAIYKAAGKIPILGSLRDKLFPENQYPDTPTAVGGGGASGEQIQEQESIVKATEKYQEKLQDILKDSAEKKLDIERDYQRKLADIAQDYQNKLQDIARETAQKREDALRDYNQKVEDINRDTNLKIQEAQDDFRQKEIDREAEYQNRLRELREKFLFDLEDALHERDARQVLRLVRQYNLDKKNLEERRKLQEKEDQIDLQQKIAELERERQLKLAAAKREYDEKLQEIAIGEQRALEEARIWQQRQLADARLWHQRQLQEQREYLQRKLRDLAEAIAREFDLTAAGAQAITSLLGSYFGSSGQIPSLLSNFNKAISGVTAPGAFADFGSTFDKLTSGHGYGFAEGGTFIATRPTTVTLGEKGAEMATFTPLTKVGQDVGKVFGNAPVGQQGGSLNLRIMLQDGLIADIVETSLEAVSSHIEIIEREK